MAAPLPAFPISYVCAKPSVYLENHYILVLKGDAIPITRPIFTRGKEICKPTVDPQGMWGDLEWTMLPQLYEPRSPWLPCIPIRVDGGHVTRALISKDMTRVRERGPSEVTPRMLVPVPELLEELKQYAANVISEARENMEILQKATDLCEGTSIVWPEEIVARALAQLRRIIAGVPSARSFVYAWAALRRAILELEGFCVWGIMMRAAPERRAAVASAYSHDQECEYRGAFFSGTREEWLDPTSTLRRTCALVTQWNVNVYAFVSASDWDIRPGQVLPVLEAPFNISAGVQGKLPRCMDKNSTKPILDTEARQLIFWCYPPRVAGEHFETAARGLRDHSEQGEEGELYLVMMKASRRLETQG